MLETAGELFWEILQLQSKLSVCMRLSFYLSVFETVQYFRFSIDMILLRVRDTSTDVRKEAYKQIKKLSLTNLSIKQRNWLLKSGLEERYQTYLFMIWF